MEGEQISADTLLADLGSDSLDTVELVMELEEACEFSIADDAAGKTWTIGDVIRHIVPWRRGE